MEQIQMQHSNDEVVALLTQIRDNLDQSNRKERRANFLLFINSLGTILLIAAIVAVAIFVVPRTVKLVNEVETVLQVLEDANIDKVAEQIQGFAVTGEAALKSVNDAAGKLVALDIDTLNDAIEELTGAAGSFSTISFDKLNEAIKNLSGISSKMARFFGVE